MLEDAFVVRDRAALAALFEDGAVLVTSRPAREARGARAIAEAATDLWGRDETCVACPDSVVQARDTALLLGPPGIGVMRRAPDGTWRYAIALLVTEHNRQESA